MRVLTTRMLQEDIEHLVDLSDEIRRARLARMRARNPPVPDISGHSPVPHAPEPPPFYPEERFSSEQARWQDGRPRQRVVVVEASPGRRQYREVPID